MIVLIFNAGSSSLKATTMSVPDGTVLSSGSADWAGERTRYAYSSREDVTHSGEVHWTGHAASVRQFLSDVASDRSLSDRPILAAGHRIVHGGDFSASVRITSQVREQVLNLAALAPLHNRQSLETLSVVEAELPHIPHIAAFDTAFHATLSPAALTYPVPHQWTREWGIRRYGFHGLSHAYCAQRAAEMLEQPLDRLRLVICHLGHGCSATAVQSGRSVDTTMGFTPMDGLMMATRCGTIDPGILFHVQREHGLSLDMLEMMLNRESGLLGISGLSADMREVLAAANAGNEDAALALSVYAHRVRKSIGALAVTMGGVDAVVFTAGVGEHAGEMRRLICSGLECLGLEIDQQANARCHPDADVASGGSTGRILVIATREDITIFRDVMGVLHNSDEPSSF